MCADKRRQKGVFFIRFKKRRVEDNVGLITSEEEVIFESFVEDVKQLVKYTKEAEHFSSVIVGRSNRHVSYIGRICRLLYFNSRCC